MYFWRQGRSARSTAPDNIFAHDRRFPYTAIGIAKQMSPDELLDGGSTGEKLWPWAVIELPDRTRARQLTLPDSFLRSTRPRLG